MPSESYIRSVYNEIQVGFNMDMFMESQKLKYPLPPPPKK